MKRLTEKIGDDVVLAGNHSVIELTERLHQFEQVFCKDTVHQLKSLRDHCKSMIDEQDPESPWCEDVRVLELLLALVEDYI